MKEYIKYLLNDESFTKEELQEEFDGLLEDKLRQHKFEDCKILCQAGAKLIYPFNAQYYDDALVVKFLIENNVVDINLKNGNGKTLYSYAECGYDITRKNGYKQVMDYLALKGAEKILFSQKEKDILKHDYQQDCKLVELVERGDIAKESVDFYEYRKVCAKYKLLSWGLLDKKQIKENDERTK